MTDATVLVSSNGPVRTLTLNRPSALNSLTAAMHGELMAALDDVASDQAIRCLVLTGAGRGFCAGQDLADPAMGPDADVGDVVLRLYRPLVQRLRSLPVPVVAAVNGVAAGAGANIALNCDLVLAARSASFIQAFSKIGLVPDAGGTWLLPRLVGRAQAIGLAMLGDKLPAADAERLGLIWHCVDDAELTGAVQALATRLAAMPTQALVATRQAIDAAQHLDMDAALAAEASVQSRLGEAHDFREGVAAFSAKRAPVFKDR
ncbi:MAG: 2-(1,2-epoxy-1,2-dihydrophenyl)acetyl-CoA isomerase PaaG [Pseudomonadota bacterium]|nr:2-(1,2-epoxy-1,2-dihydrophenyl)acetyl-CoA isomerase PaaG [Pseudomonadota bacterium]